MIINSVIKGGSGNFKTITSSKSGNGQVYPTGTLGATKGQNFSLYFLPDSGYVVGNVIVDGTSQGTPQTYTFSNVQADHSLSVSFEEKQYQYTLGIPSGSGNPATNNIYWADDAFGLTETQRNDLIKEHTHFAVVNWNGNEPYVNYWLYRENLSLKATDETCDVSAGTMSNLTGNDGDVMVLYDPVWWKVTKSGNDWRITFRWTEPAESGWVSPHTYTNGTAKYVGLGVFEAINRTYQMRSVNLSSGPSRDITQNEFYEAATYGRNWQYNNMLPMTYAWYIIQLYFVKGNRDCQAAYGYGICDESSVRAVNLNWDATSPWINGSTSNLTRGVTALGIHNPWGNTSTFLGEMWNDGGTVRFSALGGYDHHNIESGPKPSTWKSLSMYTTDSWACISEISGTCQEFPFMATSVTGDNYTQYYADAAYGSTDSGCAVAMGGHYDLTQSCGPLYVDAYNEASYGMDTIGARLHVIITE